MIFPKAGMKIAAPAIVKKLTHVITVPEMAIGKKLLAWEYITIPKALKKPMRKKMKPYHKGLSILKIPIKGNRLTV